MSPQSVISMSIFELLKAGPGPSSSHTIGPMKAGADFAALVRELPENIKARAGGVRIRLWGSLSATGPGHGTDRALIAGLMGYEPTDCPPGFLNRLTDLPPEELRLDLGGRRLPLGLDNIQYGPIHHKRPYSNTLMIDLLDRPFHPNPSARLLPPPFDEEAAGPDPLAGNIIFSREYYSVGGGFIQWKGWEPPQRGLLPHPYRNCRELLAVLSEKSISLDRLMMENESALTGQASREITAGLDKLMEIMKGAVRRGREASGRLPGNIGLYRKARELYVKSASMVEFDRHLAQLNAYAYAAAEENAAGDIIVTAPTCGSAGVIPAVLVFMEDHLKLGPDSQRKGLLAATAMGFIAKQNAGIAGAEVGCQGEIGVASAMAAALLAHSRGFEAKVVENAAEIALEHHLGLTCDPVGGYVQIPCIERNAMGALKAYNACLVASAEDVKRHRVNLDSAIRAMGETGKDMNSKYKETAKGGLAVCLTEC